MTIRQRIISLFDDSSFRAPVLKLLSGTGAAFLIGYLAKFALLRLYSPEYWGMTDYIISWVSILVPFSSLRFEDALMLPEDRRRSAHAYLLAISMVVVTAVLMLALISFYDPIARFFLEKGVGRWSLIIPLALVASRFAKISELWLIRQESFNHISAGQVVQTGSMTGLRITAGIIGPGPGGLIWGFVLGYLFSFATYSRRVVTTLRASLGGAPSLSEMRYVARRYRKFPIFTMPAAILSALITMLPMLVIPEYFDWKIMGQFSQGFKVLFVPLSLIAAAIAQVFFVRAVETHRAGTLAEFASNVHSRLVLMAIFPVTILMVAGGDIMQTFFGSEWRLSGEFLRYLAPWIMFSIVGSPMTRLFDVLERQKLEFVTALVMFSAMVAALLLGGASGDIMTMVIYLGVVGSIVRMGQIILLLYLSGTSLRSTLLPYLKYTATVLPGLVGVYFVSRYFDPIYTTAASLLAGILFTGYVLKSEGLLDHKE